MADYKISLGVDVDVSDIQSQINKAESQVDPIKIKIDAETKELTNSIRDALKSLTSSTKNALTLDTSKIESSLNDVNSTIKEIKTSLGTLDSKSGMKSLLSSINQIGGALEKASNKFVELSKNLNTLSGKDISLNFGVNLGSSDPVARQAAYGNKARGETLPQLRKQVDSLVKYYNSVYNENANQFEALQRLVSGTKLNTGDFLQRFLFDSGKDSWTSRLSGKGSLASQMQAYQEYIDMFKNAASLKGIDLSSVTSGFSKTADELVRDAQDIQTGAKEMDNAFDKLKQIFGGGNNFNVEGISVQLDSIVANLGEVKVALQGLSSGVSLGGLTSSFDRLSNSIENLLTNAEKVRGVLNNNLNTSVTGNTSTHSTGTSAIKNAQEVGQKVGEVITKSAQQSINIDDVIDEQVLGLMNEFLGVGDKGSDAFNEIKQAVIECRNELNILKNGDYENILDAHGSTEAVDKVTKAIANQMKVVKETIKSHQTLSDYIAEYHNNGYKVHVPDSVRQEYGDDYNRMAKEISSRVFTSGRGEDFESFISQLNGQLGETINLANGAEDAFKQLYDEVIYDRQRRDESNKSDKYLTSVASPEEILEQNGISKEDISNHTREIVDVINLAEQQIAQASTQSTNTVVQNGERKQQAYQETANIIQSVSKQTSLVRGNVDFEQVFDSGNQSAKEAQKYFETLLKEEKAVVSVKENFDKSLGNSGELKSFTVDIQRATGEIEKLHYAMSSADNDNRFLYQGASVSDRNIEKLTEARIKSADRLQTQLEEIKTKYKDMGSAKPIKDSDHINALDKQYRKVEKAIDNVRNADNTMSASAISNVEKQKSILESMVREYRNAETIATSLRSKDIGTVKATYGSDLDVLIQKMKDAGVYTSGFEKGAENLRTVLTDATDPSGLVSFLNGFDKLEAGYKRVAQTAKSLTQTKLYGQKASGIESEINGWQRINPEINKFEAEIDGAKISVQSLLNELGQVKTKSDFQIAEGNFKAFKKAAESAGIALTETDADFNRLKSLAKEINSIEFKVAGLDAGKNETEINELTISLNRLHKEYENLFATTNKNLSGSQISQLDDIFEKAGDKLRQLDAKIADTKAKLANDIKLDIELGNFDNEIDAMRVKFNSLSDANNELRRSYNATEDAYRAMMNAAKANTGDEVADRERLIQAEKEYAAALEKTNNLIKIQARADKIDNDRIKLQDNREVFQAKIDTWMAKNSAATKKFGAELLDLRAKAEKADQVQLNHLEKELTKIDKAADKAGLKMMSFGDRIKSKAKEYMAYFSIAELFMYAEQAFRSMFEQVKLIDSAMTELKKVTDETDASYDRFLTNAATRAKEIGATIDGLVSSTADFARLGYNMSDSAELAEVANIYAVVGDEIDSVETATKSLISTMTAFGIEASDSMSIVDKFNAVGNNFAISSGGIGDALERSASSMAAANNSLDETIALITAANTVVQDADAVGRLMPTIKVAISVKLQRWIRPRKDFISIF